MTKTTTNSGAIRKFFEADGGKKITFQDLKELSSEDRAELGALAAEALGLKIEAKKKK